MWPINDFIFTFFPGYAPLRSKAGQGCSGPVGCEHTNPWHVQMLVLGLILRCLDPVLTIVASLSSKPLFVSPLTMREEATQYDIYLFVS